VPRDLANRLENIFLGDGTMHGASVMCLLASPRGAHLASSREAHRASRISNAGRRSASVPRASRPAGLRVTAMSAPEPSPLDGKKSRCLPLPIATPQGYMWTAVRRLRPSTEEEATCTPTKNACSLERITMKYDERCASCGGSGFVKTRSFKSSRRNSRSTVGKCLLCGGVGFVRVNTVRVEPDFSKDDSMPADYDPMDFGFPKGEQGPFCELKEKTWRKHAGKRAKTAGWDEKDVGPAGNAMGPR